MKFIITFAIFAVVAVAVVSAYPTPDETLEELSELPEHQPINELEVHHIRSKRATCDLLSFTAANIKLNHAACAAHCLLMFRGFTGGFCTSRGICNCRR